MGDPAKASDADPSAVPDWAAVCERLETASSDLERARSDYTAAAYLASVSTALRGLPDAERRPPVVLLAEQYAALGDAERAFIETCLGCPLSDLTVAAGVVAGMLRVADLQTAVDDVYRIFHAQPPGVATPLRDFFNQSLWVLFSLSHEVCVRGMTMLEDRLAGLEECADYLIAQGVAVAKPSGHEIVEATRAAVPIDFLPEASLFALDRFKELLIPAVGTALPPIGLIVAACHTLYSINSELKRDHQTRLERKAAFAAPNAYEVAQTTYLAMAKQNALIESSGAVLSNLSKDVDQIRVEIQALMAPMKRTERQTRETRQMLDDFDAALQAARKSLVKSEAIAAELRRGAEEQLARLEGRADRLGHE